mmetsp:Transcript_38464/g.116311  ORF Transcript_38464/g.116311 Transcript_38464/m.116311 type:complete len:205 (-) Transcript_38464:44-658(-)
MLAFLTMATLLEIREDCTNRAVSLLAAWGLTRMTAWFLTCAPNSLTITSWAHLHASSGDCSALMRRNKPKRRKWSATGGEWRAKAWQRCAATSEVYAALSPTLPRMTNLCTETSSEHSNMSTQRRLTLSPRLLFHASKLSRFRGKPSTKNLPPSQPSLSMALWSKSRTISAGTSLPLQICMSIRPAIFEPGRFDSARSKSPTSM